MAETDGYVIEAFLDALKEMRDAAEFERLMAGAGDSQPRDGMMEEIQDRLDRMTVRAASPHREPSALDVLRGRQALERLQQRYPEVWECAELSEVCDA